MNIQEIKNCYSTHLNKDTICRLIDKKYDEYRKNSSEGESCKMVIEYLLDMSNPEEFILALLKVVSKTPS